MRRLFYFFLAATALIASRGYSATDTKSVALSFYLVSEEKIDGGRFIDTLDFPKLGYIAAKPDLIITQLVAVSESVAHSSMGKIDKNGKLIETTPLPDSPALDVTILAEDAQKLTALTEHNIGKKVLLMLGDVPLMAPRINSPISSQFQLTIKDDTERKKVEDGLKKLVH